MRRRDIIKGALSVTAGSIATAGKVAGRKQNSKKQNDKIISTATKLLRKSRFIENERASERLKKNAERLLEKNNIKYKSSIGKPTDFDGSGDDSVSIQNRYGSPSEHSDTKLVLSTFTPIDEDCSNYPCYEYGTRRIDISWYLYENPSFWGPDNPCPPDAAAIFWNNNVFQPVESGRSNFFDSYTFTRYTAGGGDVSYQEYDIANGGVIAEVDSPQPGTDGKTGVFGGGYSIKLDVVGDDPDNHPIKAKYVHNYRFQQGCILSDYGVSLGAGGISISPSDVKNWSMSTQESVFSSDS